jgi:hypothetical protein
MFLFVIVAAMMVVIHVAAGWERPRLAVILSGILWLLYAVYEYQVASGVLCDSDCNIRVDLVFFIPILGLATYCAYQAYMGRPGQHKIIGTVLGVIVLFALALVAEGLGYGNLASIGLLLSLVTIGIYAVKSKSKAKRT